MIRAIEPDRLPSLPELSGSISCTETVVPGHDAINLFVRHYRVSETPGARTLFVVHGMSEHGARYEHVARTAAARGWNVLIADLRGHGRSGGIPTHVDDFAQYVQDLDIVRERFGLVPHSTAVLGHSMGGLITARMLQQNPSAFSAAVLTSPLLAVKVPISPFTIALGRAASLVYPQARFRSRVDVQFTTRNREVLERRAADPYNNRSVTAAWFFAMEAALKSVWEQAARIACPLLLMQAGADQIVDPDAARGWFDTLASSDKTFRLFPEHYHELVNEPDWHDTVAAILDWIDARVLPVASIGTPEILTA